MTTNTAPQHDDAFWVIGGYYTDTDFKTISDGFSEEVHGPYPTYDDAKKMWMSRSWATVDQATSRYRILTNEQMKEHHQ